MYSLELHSLKETDMIGQLIGNHILSGSIILLFGNLGSGKTTLTKSLCAELGVNPDIVISPTYTLVNIYFGKWPIHHVDLFRLSSLEDLDSFDRDDLISDEGLTIVEWPELLTSYLTTEPQLSIEIQLTGDTSRSFNFQSKNASFDSLFQSLKNYESSRN